MEKQRRKWSFDRIGELFTVTVRRFPLPLAAALAGTLFAILEINSGADLEWTMKAIVASIVAFLLLLAVAIAHENKKLSVPVLSLTYLAVALLVAGFAWFIPTDFQQWFDMHLGRTWLWIGSAVMLVFLAPFRDWEKNSSAPLWNHGVAGIVGIILAYLLSGILMIGVAAAIGSVDALFDISIDGETYSYAAAIIFGLLGPLLFVSRIAKPDELAQPNNFTKELKIAAYGILLPLTIVYFVILFLYAGIKLPGGGWPEALISYMIVGFSVVGVITHALLYPIIKERQWLKIGVRALYIAITLQSIVLFWSVGVRAASFGWTDNRVFVFVFGAWLVGLAAYFLFRKGYDLRVIPASLFVIMIVFGSFGPWSAFSIGEASQTARFENLAEEYGVLAEDGTIGMGEVELTSDQSKELYSIMAYLVDTHGPLVMQPYTNEDLTPITDAKWKYNVPGRVSSALFGEKFKQPAENFNDPFSDEEYFYYNTYGTGATDVQSISGYDYLLRFEGYDGNKKEEFTIDGTAYTLAVRLKNREFHLTDDSTLDVTVDATDLIEELKLKYGTAPRESVPFSDMILTHDDDRVSLQFIFADISGQVDDGTTTLGNMNGTMLLRVK